MNPREAKGPSDVTRGLNNILRITTPGTIVPKDELSLSPEDISRKQVIADEIRQALAKLPHAPDRLSLPENERPSLEDTLRQNLLGLVGDSRLIKDIFPQMQTNIEARGTIAEIDPIWGPVLPLLTSFEMHKASTGFRALRLFYENLQADKERRQDRINLLMYDSLRPRENGILETVGDLRKLPLKTWSRISNIGTISAVMMHDSLRKVEIPTT